VGKIAKSLGADCVFIVSDKGLVSIGMVDQIAAACTKAGLAVTVFDDVMPNPLVSTVDHGASVLAGMKGNPVVLTLGGGSVMDAGKCMAAMLGNPGESIANFMAVPKLNPKTDSLDMRSVSVQNRPKKAAPIIAIPTTSGTGSETNGAAVVTDDASHKKYFFVDELARAKAIVLDPTLTQGMPVYPSACCGFDVLAHAMEAFTSNRTNSISDAMAIGAIRIVAKNLVPLVKDPQNLELRAQMQMGSYMAATAFDIAQLGLIHATGHQLTAMYNQVDFNVISFQVSLAIFYNLLWTTHLFLQSLSWSLPSSPPPPPLPLIYNCG
jgi:alcohol dehydrogenase class IV